MGQRTQILLRQHTGDTKKTVAIHNYWGFGRPTVTGAIGIIQMIVNTTTPSYEIESSMQIMASRPFGFDELFNWTKIYKCSNGYDHQEHDNNDGYVIIDVYLDKIGYNQDRSKDCYKVQFYNYDGDKLTADEYLEYCDCEQYQSDQWKIWYNKNKYLLDDVQSLIESST